MTTLSMTRRNQDQSEHRDSLFPNAAFPLSGDSSLQCSNSTVHSLQLIPLHTHSWQSWDEWWWIQCWADSWQTTLPQSSRKMNPLSKWSRRGMRRWSGESSIQSWENGVHSLIPILSPFHPQLTNCDSRLPAILFLWIKTLQIQSISTHSTRSTECVGNISIQTQLIPQHPHCSLLSIHSPRMNHFLFPFNSLSHTLLSSTTHLLTHLHSVPNCWCQTQRSPIHSLTTNSPLFQYPFHTNSTLFYETDHNPILSTFHYELEPNDRNPLYQNRL